MKAFNKDIVRSIRHSLGLMQRAGVEADMQREDTDDGILLTIRIPKRAKEAGYPAKLSPNCDSFSHKLWYTETTGREVPVRKIGRNRRSQHG